MNRLARFLLAPWGRRPTPTDPSAQTRDLGRRGERLAERTLRRRGYRLLARNARVPVGEADLVMLAPDGVTRVVVEVKTRLVVQADAHAPPPEAAVHAAKQRKLLAVARHLRRANGWTNLPIRIDVVAVDWPPIGSPEVRHFENAVRG